MIVNQKGLFELWSRIGALQSRIGALQGLLKRQEAPTFKSAPAKGPRGVKRRYKKRRRREHVRTLQRNAWRSHFEALKREKGAS